MCLYCEKVKSAKRSEYTFNKKKKPGNLKHFNGDQMSFKKKKTKQLKSPKRMKPLSAAVRGS